MKCVRIAIFGHKNSNKSRFIETLTGMRIYSLSITEKEEFLDEISYSKSIDATFGRLYVRENLIIDFFSASPEDDIAQIYAIMGEELKGIIVYLDVSDEVTIYYARDIIELLNRESDIPYIIISDGWRNENTVQTEKLYEMLNVGKEHLIVPCDCKNKESTKVVADYLFDMIKMRMN